MARAAKKAAKATKPARVPAPAVKPVTAKTVVVSVLAPAERVSLRAPEASVNSLSRALGVTLPKTPKSSTTKGSRTALWLGPDEWLVFGEEGSSLLEDCARAKGLHSAVGISHRNVAFSVEGEGAEATLSAGCPQDLSLAVFPVGACSRTILGKIEIIVLRTGENAFRVECWRSFSDYAFAFLADAARDAAA